MTPSSGRAIPAGLMALYENGADRHWCSDFTGKQEFTKAVGLRPQPGDTGDQRLLNLLRTLPPVMRWVVEIRTGVWSGDCTPHDFKFIGEWAGGLSPAAARALYLTGLELLNAEARLCGMQPGPIRANTSRNANGIARPYQKLRFAIFKRDGYRCRICGLDADSGTRLELDHIIPVGKGGSDGEENLWTLCEDCNRGKGVDAL